MRIIKFNKQRPSATDETETINQIAMQAQQVAQTLSDYFEIRVDSQGNTMLVAKYDLASVGEVSSNVDAEAENE